MPAAALCVQWCIRKAFGWYYETWGDRLEVAYIYFDRDEPFMHDFRQRWLRENKKRVVFLNTFWGSIVEVEALDSKETPALQAADFIAWAASRGRSSVEDRPYRHLVNIHELIMPRWKLTLDEDVLRRKHFTFVEDEGNVVGVDELSGVGSEPLEGSGLG